LRAASRSNSSIELAVTGRVAVAEVSVRSPSSVQDGLRADNTAW
jgi:hypothetical protein